jgi:hypothetical protein
MLRLVGRPGARIYCDYDGRIPADVSQRLQMVVRVERLRVQYVRFDRTRHGYHMVVAVSNRLSPYRLVMIQLLLGSDWKREAFNAQRVKRLRDLPAFWRARWNVLYHTHYRRVSL